MLAFASASSTGATRAHSEYIVGVRDILDIRVFDEPDLSKEASVSEAGDIRFPLLGSLRVAGLTPRQIEVLIAQKLGERYLVAPQVFVALKEYNSRRAVVLGMVKNPGTYALMGETTVLDLVSRAGGVLETGGKTWVLVRRGNRPSEKTEPPLLIDANRLLRRGEKQLNIAVEDGDTLFVPKSDGVYVYGEVKKPGVVLYRDGLTVLQAISLAEGLSARANPGKVQIIRTDEGREQKIRVDLDAIVDDARRDVVLKPEDIIVVPESFL